MKRVMTCCVISVCISFGPTVLRWRCMTSGRRAGAMSREAATMSSFLSCNQGRAARRSLPVFSRLLVSYPPSGILRLRRICLVSCLIVSPTNSIRPHRCHQSRQLLQRLSPLSRPRPQFFQTIIPIITTTLSRKSLMLQRTSPNSKHFDAGRCCCIISTPGIVAGLT